MNWKPILSFTDESKSFVHGFEAGRIWATLSSDIEDEHSFTIHGENAELMLRMAESTGRQLIWEEIDDPIWCRVTFGPGKRE